MYREKSTVRKLFNRLSVVQLISMYYVAAVTLVTILLSLPIAHKDGVSLSFMDVLFTSVSSVSVTGLTVVSTAESFSFFGVIVIALALQIGGLGVMALGTLIWLILGRKIGFRERRMIMTDQNTQSISGIVRLVKDMLILILTIEFIGFMILGTYYLNYYDSILEAYYQGFFSAISAVTNGGFDITGSSLQPFQHDYFVQFVHILLIISGAIGFPVLIEVKEYVKISPEERNLKRFSLFTKLTTFTYFALLAFSFVIILFLEFNHYFADKSWHEILFTSLFQSTTARSAGLTTMDINAFTEQTQVFLSSMMFIGASPSSVGGGIRTTTFALVIIFILTFARGQTNIKIFGRQIEEEDLFKAVVVTLLAIIMFITVTIIVTAIEPFSLTSIIFEVSSAFGTTGLSTGITSKLSSFSQILLMLLMFIGRIGLLTFLFTFNKQQTKSNYRYPTERINIG
ncbi:TrkH family potassium uptake protein [Tenuibacillus multivorans]|uniref:Trk-type K+ transport system, membrane component n=1 Tax=Tenuibacillus multivorans TaxID=237069 RepID=A0A1G9YFV9_9BACI|nr:TrkH family potassium uptake protein [Tenuibacillus multivorans]GEL76064.1 ktr system potassium uptake protein D [Tenuibacillus multivorans]SDN07361.1 Trk-type K+ transport system, membrane component [Tenuibacillus multivorans]